MRPSGIRKFFDLAAEMPECISLGVGEPDFKTPWAVREAGIESLEHGRTRYTSNAGLKELRAEITRYLARRMNLHYEPSQVLVTVGGSEAIDMCIRTLVQPGDEVVIPEPCFVCYEPITTLSGGVPVHVPCRQEDEFRLRPEALKAAITPKTKLLIMPFPNNPTGAVMEREDLEAIAEVLRDTNVMVLSDEIYAELNYGLRPHVSIATLPGMAERTIVVNGFSKTYAMTGWRLGYACGPAPIIKIMTKIHQSAIMSAPTTSQYAAITALRECDGEIDKMRDEYNMRRRLVVHGFNSMGLTCFEPRGAFYAFPCIKSTGMTSQEFCTKLLEQNAVTKRQYDAAKTDYEAKKARYEMLARQRSASSSVMAETRQRIAQNDAGIELAKALLETAELNLSYCVITAPCDGYASRKEIQEGQLVQPGQTLLDVVDSSDVWVTANYKETQLRHIEPGSAVRIKVDAIPDVTFSGTVQSISKATGASLSVLPQDNSAGNFVKVRQRVPVRIVFSESNNAADMERLRAGMNVECEVEY